MMHQGVTSFYRRFDFFDREEIATDANADEKSSVSSIRRNEQKSDKEDNGGLSLFEDFEPNCAASGHGLLCFGDNSGQIQFINRDLQIFKFKSHSERITKLFKTKNNDYLVVVGKHQEQPQLIETFIKIWSLSDLNELGQPKQVRSFKAFNDGIESPISALAVTESCTQIALGLATGSVLLYDLNLKSTRAPKVFKLTKEDEQSVTGLHYLENPHDPLLYVITVEAVLCYYMRRKGMPYVILDNSGGSDLNCSSLHDVDELVVAKSETVHLFKGDQRRGEHAFPGEKKMVRSFRRYIIVVCSYLGLKQRHANRVEVTIYDQDNKYIAFRRPFDDLIDIISEWGCVFVLTKKTLSKLRDKDLQEKLNEFFRFNLYEKAIQLARSEGSDETRIINYYAKYGDHLYQKGDYDGAMEQYLQTIDKDSTIEPSYVIRKYLDAQKIKNLTEYLATLHEKGTPTPDHTTLLLNCYTKLKDSSKLNEFINVQPNTYGRKSKKYYQFDVNTAIRVCREAGLLEHARILAKQNKYHEVYLDILLEEAALGNLRKYQEALDYIQQLPFLQAEANMKRIGKTLIEKEPKGSTELIKLLCTKPPVPDDAAAVAAQGPNASGPATGPASGLASGLASGPASSGGAMLQAKDTLDELGLHSLGFSPAAGPQSQSQGHGKSSRFKLLRANPEEFIHLFVRRPRELKDFLEFLVECELSKQICSTMVYHTLLEIYMRDVFELQQKLQTTGKTGAQMEAQKKEIENVKGKIMRVLRQETNYDQTHALSLAKLYRVEEAVVYLYEQLRLFREIVSHYIDQKANQKILETCQKFNDSDTSLWVHAFTYFCYAPKCDKEIKICLNQIHAQNLMPPLMVVELLANADVTLDVVRDYIKDDLQTQQKLIARDEQEIGKLQRDIASFKSEIEELTTKPKTFQATKCSACLAPLDLPTIHFLCGHSLHERCLISKEDVRCPNCQQEHEDIYSRQQMMQRSRGDHDTFFAQLKLAHDQGDAFNTVAEYFGRGVIH